MSYYSQDVRNALFQTLLKRIPPKEHSPHLEDLVNILLDALSRGELEVCFQEKMHLSKLNHPGWPQAHKKALRASGWLTGESAPMVLEGDQLSWRRWHNEINEAVEDLLSRSKLRHRVLCNPLK